MTSPDAPIEIVSYDPVWPTRFEEEAALLRRRLTPWLVGPIEHIGSTAVPDLAAKPVIDIMAGVQALETSRPAIAAATELGYRYWPYQADVEHWFCKPSPAFRTHHLYLIPVGGGPQTEPCDSPAILVSGHPRIAGDLPPERLRRADALSGSHGA